MFAILGMGLMLAGCSGGVTGLFAPAAVETYDLHVDAPDVLKTPGARQLVVSEPTALRWLDSDRLVVKTAAGAITYLPKMQWSDRLPKLLQARLLETLECTKHYRAVGRPGDGLKADHELQVDIRRFEIQEGESGVAHVQLAARLLSHTSGRIKATKLFEAQESIEKINAATSSAGLNAALARAVGDLTRWAVGIY